MTDPSPFVKEELEDERITKMIKEGEVLESIERNIEWKEEAKATKASIGFRFVGETIFKIKDGVNLEGRIVLPGRPQDAPPAGPARSARALDLPDSRRQQLENSTRSTKDKIVCSMESTGWTTSRSTQVIEVHNLRRGRQ